ncbi:DJ-1/PfpI family protein [Dokdonia sp. MED134]|uniref:DJ-1/PfpI family protein n=1 Tax=Dokdonia sp. MED134 TaxID=313590 RepID=UPI000068AC94|nr:DJ-1/PfpI family protein [Dokdonia sp. MED134]EAQ39961.1 DJ-1/PfpI family protein [Dokdonia sp. MED134]
MKYYILLLTTLILIGCNTEPKTIEQPAVTNKVDNAFAKAKPVLDSTRYNVAFLIMDGTFNTELTAPFDIFQHTIYRENIKAMNVFTVANTLQPVRTFEGMYLLPDFDYTSEDLPKIDILVVPSAEHHLDTDLEDEALINFVKKVDKEAMYVTSHCDGAFVLAKAGLLGNSVSTTFPSDIDKMRETFPNLDIRKDVLFVHDGKYITSAGGAKSFEAALYLTELLYGAEIARSLAGGLVIDWKLDNVPHLITK